MKIKITDPRGLRVGDRTIPEGEIIDLNSGPVLDAALRFKQAEQVKEIARPPAAPAQTPPVTPQGDAGVIPVDAPPATAAAPATTPAPVVTPQKPAHVDEKKKK